MALSASILYSGNGAAFAFYPAAGTARVLPGTSLAIVLALPGTATQCTYSVTAPGTTLDGEGPLVSYAAPFLGTWQLPHAPTTITITVSVTDGSTTVTASYIFQFLNTPTINVQWFGAKGDGVTDDTAAINRAVALFVANMATAAPAGPNTGGSVLYFPAGYYNIQSPITIKGITGGLVLGDGMFASVLGDGPKGSAGSTAFCGARGMLIFENCYQTSCEDLQVSGEAHFTRLSANVTAGATSIQVLDATNISVGQRIGLHYASEIGIAEMVSVVGKSGNTLTVTGAGGTILHNYTGNGGGTGDYVCFGPLGAVTAYSSYNGSGMYSHGVRFNRVIFNNSQTVNCLFSFATDTLGGAPTTLAANAPSGQPVATVTDASQIVVGKQVRIWQRFDAAGDILTVQSINYATGAVTFTSNIVGLNGTLGGGGYAIGNCYIVSYPADSNNDEHLFTQCVFSGGNVACVGLQGWNCLGLTFVQCEGSAPAIVSARQGGSWRWIGGDASGLSVDWEFGGGIQGAIEIDHIATEGSSAMFLCRAADQASNLILWSSNYAKRGTPQADIGTNIIDITSQFMQAHFSNCDIEPGAVSGFGLNFSDTHTTGTVTMIGCASGASKYSLDGVGLIDHDTLWTTTAGGNIPPVETFTNGGFVRSFGAIYSWLNAGALPLERGQISYGNTTVTTPTTGTITLTVAQYSSPRILLSMTLTGNITLMFPNAIGSWRVDLSGVTFGGFTCAFKSGTTTSASVASITTTADFVDIETYGGSKISVGTL